MKTIINGQEYEVLRPGVYVLYQNGKERMRVWNVGEIIADRRKQLHISQDQLAEAVGLNRSTISRYESGIAKKIPHDVAEAIATTLNCTVDYLMGRSDEPNQIFQMPNYDAQAERVLTYFKKLSAEQKNAVETMIKTMIKEE